LIHDFSDFSDRHPALLASFFFLIGLGLAKGYALELSLPLLLVSAPLAKKAFSKLLPLFVFLIIAFFYGLYKAPHFPSSQNEFTGKALFIPSEIKTHRSHFKKTLWLKGSIRYMVTQEGSVLKNIPCLINLSKDHPKIDSHFYLEGVLQKADHSFFFTPEKSSPWTAAPHTFSLAEIRFQAKKILSKQIGSLFTDPKIFRFLTALCLGDLDDRMLSFDFARLGLQHILAISGFHFGLLAFFLHALFRFFLPEKWVYLLLLLGLTAYFLLLGSSSLHSR
jgi:competence protein ComEC